jgi:hypothetical protein
MTTRTARGCWSFLLSVLATISPALTDITDTSTLADVRDLAHGAKAIAGLQTGELDIGVVKEACARLCGGVSPSAKQTGI